MKNYMEIAEEYGIADKIGKLEVELSSLPDVLDVEWDLTGFLSNIYQVIFLLHYDIRADREDYWDARRNLKKRAVEIINNNDLYKTEDTIEDYGEHFYFVSGCKESWRKGQL